MVLNYLVDAMVSSIGNTRASSMFGDHLIISKVAKSTQDKKQSNILSVQGVSDDKNRAPTDFKFNRNEQILWQKRQQHIMLTTKVWQKQHLQPESGRKRKKKEDSEKINVNYLSSRQNT